jgi:hypothetical protein
MGTPIVPSEVGGVREEIGRRVDVDQLSIRVYGNSIMIELTVK